MKSSSKICLIGDIVVDITSKNSNRDIKLRLGGIVHAARCLWSLDISFDVGYFAPAYLDESIVKYLNSLGCFEIFKLGNVIGAPYVFLIEEAKEIGNQGYEFILRDNIKLEYNQLTFNAIVNENYSDVVLISGNYDIHRFINSLKGAIHI
ncbi:MAG TPA: hypothetical protein VGM63_01195, partial [Mucilaginibacter sp.]